MRRLAASVLLFLLVLVHRTHAQRPGDKLRRIDIQQQINPALLERSRFVTADSQATLTQGDTARVKPGDVIAVPTGERATRDTSHGSGTDDHVDLPVRLVTVDRTGTQVLALAIRVAAEGGGLTFNVSTRDFSGDVLIGIEDSLRRTEQIALGRPMELQVTSDAGSVQPQTIRIAHTNIPWQRVRLVASAPRDTVHLIVRAVFRPEGYAARVAVDWPRIDVRPASANIQGLGLEKVPVSVTVPLRALLDESRRA